VTAFADASAIVKLYADEAGTEQVGTETGPFILAALTRVETTSALWQKNRAGSLGTAFARRLADAVAAELAAGHFSTGASVIELPLSTAVLMSASRLCGVHGLRAGAAIQLATALTARRVDPSCTRFWVFDHRLAEAAAREGFTTLGADPS
jgi:predicted nucleic acid-binding protein